MVPECQDLIQNAVGPCEKVRLSTRNGSSFRAL